MEVRKVPKKDSAMILEVLQQVCRSVTNESGLTPTKVVRLNCE